MPNPISGHTGVRDQFDNLASVMREMSKQTFTPGAQGKKIYEDQTKIYVKLGENERFVTDIGTEAKRAKGITVERLAETVEKVIQAAAESGAFKSKEVNELDAMIQGLEVLKNRFTVAQQSTSSLKRFFLKAFGYQDRYDAALDKINHAILIAKKKTLPLQIHQLAQKSQSLGSEITQLGEELQTLRGEAEKLKDEEKQTELTVKIEGQQKALVQLKAKQQELSATKAGLSTEIEPVKQAKAELTRAQEAVNQANKAPDIGIFGKNKAGKQVLEQAKAAEKTATKNLKEIKKKFHGTLKNLKTIKVDINHHLKQEEELSQGYQGAKARLQTIQQRQSHIHEKTEEIAEKLKEFNENQTLIEAKERELAKLTDGAVPIQIKISKKPAKLAAFTLPVSVPSNLYANLLAKLGPTSEGKTDAYVVYQRTLIFGFSMGQKRGIEEIDQHNDFELSDLKKLLEGGDATVNMFYVAHYLESLIPTAQAEKRDPDYIQALKKLQSDLQRSLSVALMASFISAVKINQQDPAQANPALSKLSKEISKELGKMQPGERLLIPTGTVGHATLLSLQKMDDGRIVPKLYNTGDGVDQHVTSGLSLKALTDQLNMLRDQYPISKTYPPVDLKTHQTGFESMMVDLLRMTFDKESTIDTMNAALRENLGEGQAGPAKPIQINGVCSFQVLGEAFKDILGSKVAYNTYKRDLLTHVQEDFQEITVAMEPLIGKDEEAKKLYAIHQAMLEDNQAQLKATEQILAQAKK